MIEHLWSYCFKKPNNFYWFFLRIRMYQPIENKILLQVYLIVIIHVQDHTGYLYELIEPSYLFSVSIQKIRSEIKVLIEYTQTKNIKIPVIFFLYEMVKRYAYSTCICMKSYDRACIFFYKSHFNLPGNLLHPYYCHCRKPQQGNYRQLKKKIQIHMY